MTRSWKPMMNHVARSVLLPLPLDLAKDMIESISLATTTTIFTTTNRIIIDLGEMQHPSSAPEGVAVVVVARVRPLHPRLAQSGNNRNKTVRVMESVKVKATSSLVTFPKMFTSRAISRQMPRSEAAVHASL